jgi:hypothetical protein
MHELTHLTILVEEQDDAHAFYRRFKPSASGLDPEGEADTTSRRVISPFSQAHGIEPFIPIESG